MNTFRFYRAPGLDRNEKRFTLIELLIVISIIAILMSILLPSLNLVREKARGISCLSNLKQNGIATTNYMDSYDGYILQWASWENIYAWTDFVYAFPDEQSKGLGHPSRRKATGTAHSEICDGTPMPSSIRGNGMPTPPRSPGPCSTRDHTLPTVLRS